MRFVPALALLFVATLPTLAGHAVELPDDPNAVVLSMDFRGGRVPRISDDPTVSIFADGRVAMPRIYAHDRSYADRISISELRELLRFTLEEVRFLDYDEAVVAARRAAIPGEAQWIHAPHHESTEIALALPGVAKTVRYVGLSPRPKLAETQAFVALRERIEQIMAIAQLGGREEAREWVALANQKLAIEAPDAAPLTLTDLISGTIRTDGSLFVQFERLAMKDQPGINLAIAGNAAGDVRIGIVRLQP